MHHQARERTKDNQSLFGSDRFLPTMPLIKTVLLSHTTSGIFCPDYGEAPNHIGCFIAKIFSKELVKNFQLKNCDL